MSTSESDIIFGVINSRRSIGRNLAFADIDSFIESSDNTCNSTRRYKVKFNRSTFLGPSSSYEDLFPTKKSNLPYGAKVKLQLRQCINSDSCVHGNDGKFDLGSCNWEVLRWKITEHPKALAEQLASLEATTTSTEAQLVSSNQPILIGNGAMSCSNYLRIRRQQFDKVKRDVINVSVPKHKSETVLSAEYCHGGKHAKAKRAKVFAAWILDTFVGISSMSGQFCELCNQNTEEPRNEHSNFEQTQNIHVLDIAGGKGHLSLELILQQSSSTGLNKSPSRITKCSIIDPVVRKGDAKMRMSKLKKIKDGGGSNQTPTPEINHFATYFNVNTMQNMQNDFFDNDGLKTELILLGLHPDQCTEDIVDAALKLNLSFAIVPCCVYPDLFPDRQHWVKEKGTNVDEQCHARIPVRSYNDFLEYLMQKDDGIQMYTLPFEGKNIVLYKKGINA